MTEKNESATGFSIEGNDRLGWTPETVKGLEAAEYAAIHLRVPKSGTVWLDEMIAEANRRDLAAKLLQSFIAAEPDRGHGFSITDALRYSDMLIEQLKTAK